MDWSQGQPEAAIDSSEPLQETRKAKVNREKNSFFIRGIRVSCSNPIFATNKN
jgi:hypothetical protein